MKVKSSIIITILLVTLACTAGQSTIFAGTRNGLKAADRQMSLSVEKFADGASRTLVVSGTGFAPGEAVSVVAAKITDDFATAPIISDWRVIAGPKGHMSVTFPADYFRGGDQRFVIRASGQNGKDSATVEFNGFAFAPSADLDQCANGSFSSPVQCTGANWQNGNVGQSSGHYYEGDSIPYRMKFDDLTTGAGNPHTVTIEWDTTQGGKHAIDYITTYNRTENVGNDPCSGIVPACGAATTFPIPLDPNVSGTGVVQLGGQVLTMWGGTITGVSAYTLSGSFAGNSSTAITITFTANQANPVLAWSGHIAKRQDWSALGGSAFDIPGSPYHTRLIELDGAGGNQDRSLAAAGVRLSSEIVIIKQAIPESSQVFGFTTTGAGLSPFQLVDDGVDNDATPNRIVFGNLLAPATSGSFSVTEDASMGFYNLSGLTCSQSVGGTSSFSTSVPSRLANITLQYGDSVTCTFTNMVTTAAGLNVGGRVITAGGTALSRVLVTIHDPASGQTRTAYTNTFGRFGFDGLQAGNFYIVEVYSRKHSFVNGTQSFILNDAVDNLEFVTVR